MIKAIKKSAFPHSEPPRHNAPKRPLPERQLLASTLPDLLSLVAPKKLRSTGKIRPPSAAAAPQRAHHALQGEPAPLPGQWAARGGGGHRSSPPAAPQQPPAAPVQRCQAMWGLQPCPSGSAEGQLWFRCAPACVAACAGGLSPRRAPAHPPLCCSFPPATAMASWAGEKSKKGREKQNKTKQNKKMQLLPLPPALLQML